MIRCSSCAKRTVGSVDTSDALLSTLCGQCTIALIEAMKADLDVAGYAYIDPRYALRHLSYPKFIEDFQTLRRNHARALIARHNAAVTL